MRLLILSDLHLEIWHKEPWREHAPRFDISVSRPDAVILAGDIGKGESGVEWAARTFPGLPVLYCAGNHEYYGGVLQDVDAGIAAACRASGTVRFLNQAGTVVNGIRFLGCPLWTDYALFGSGGRQAAMRAAEGVVLDYKRIRVEEHGDHPALRPEHTVRLHAEQRSWLAQALSNPFSGKTVVITHMAPSMRSVAERYAADPVSAAFASNLDELAAQADLWVHGHTHDGFDYEIDGCRVVCNPLGYPQRDRKGAFLGPENPAFDPNFVIEV